MARSAARSRAAAAHGTLTAWERGRLTKGGGRVLTITQGAEEALAMLRDSVEDLPENGGVRITHEADQNGDTGFALQLVEGPQQDDVVLDGHALQVFVEPEAAKLLEDTALDGEAHGAPVHLGFVQSDDEDGALDEGDEAEEGRGEAAPS